MTEAAYTYKLHCLLLSQDSDVTHVDKTMLQELNKSAEVQQHYYCNRKQQHGNYA